MKEMDGKEENEEGESKKKRQKRTILDTTHRTSTFFAFKKVRQFNNDETFVFLHERVWK